LADNFLVEQKQQARRRVLLNLSLSLFSGILLGFSFPPFKLGILACFGFVPFFILLDRIEKYGRALRYSYLTFFIFNVISIGWIGGWTVATDIFLMIGCLILLLMHPFFFCVPVFVYLFTKKHLGERIALAAFPFFWVAFEYLHSLGELAFPWLTLGNTQTYDIYRIQYITYTGVYGISFWILWMNVAFYFLYTKLAHREWRNFSWQSITTVIVVLLLYLLPQFYSWRVMPASEPEYPKLKVGIVQPHIDPWKKWEMSGFEQVQLCLAMAKGLAAKNDLDLVIWPETAITYYILLPRYHQDYNMLKQAIDTLNIPLLTGFPDVTYYLSKKDAPPGSKQISGTDQFYDSFNSIMLLEPNSYVVQRYHKIKLVPFSERVPYAETLTFLVDLVKWNVGLSGWGIGKDSTIFEIHNLRSGSAYVARFWAMVCYESIYADFVSAFVKKGAQFLIIVTNDSWWGKSSGPYQHAQYAVLRAIENRRSIARCANGGISCFIDAYGRMINPTELYTRAAIVGEVELRDELTFYTKHGDVFAISCSYVSGIIFILGIVIKIKKWAIPLVQTKS